MKMGIFQKIGRMMILPLLALSISAAVPAEAKKSKLAQSKITDIGGSIEWGYEHNSGEEEQNSKFTQEYKMQTSGHVWDPRVMEFNIGGRFSGEQIFHETKARQGETNILEFDASTKIAKKHKYPITLFADRRNTTIDRQFMDEYDITRTRYGMTVDSKNSLFPGNIRYTHMDYRDDNQISRNEYSEDNFTLALSNSFKKCHTQLRFDLKDLRDKENDDDNDDYTQYNLSLTNKTGIGKNKEASSSIRLFSKESEEADDLTYIFADETFRWDPLRSLQLYGKYSLDYRDAGYLTDQTHQVRAEFTHRLFDSLVTKGGAGVNLKDSEYNKVRSESVDLNLDYTKKLPFESRLRLGYGIDYETRGTDILDDISRIIDEEHVLSDEIPAELENAGAIESSIIVTDKDNSRTYIRNTDYVIITGRDTARIARTLTGSIEESEKVLVDYSFNTGQAHKTERILSQRHSAGISKKFREVLTMYADYSYITEDDSFWDRGYGDYRQDSITYEKRANIGADLYWRWLSLSGRITDYSSDDFRYVSFTNSGEARINPTPDTYIMIGAENNYFDYKGEPDKNYFNVTSKAQYRPSRSILLSVTGKYEIEKGGSYDGVSFTTEPKIEYRIKAWKIEVGDEFRTGKRNSWDLRQNRFFINIKRNF